MTQSLRYVLAMLVSVLPTSQAFGVNSTDVTGVWKQMSLTGAASMAAINAAPATPSDGTSPCLFFSWTDRTLTLGQIPGHPTELRGFWRKHVSWMWSTSYTQDCRWSNESNFRPTAEANIMMALSGTLDDKTGNIALNSTFLSCDGLICDRLVSDEMRG